MDAHWILSGQDLRCPHLAPSGTRPAQAALGQGTQTATNHGGSCPRRDAKHTRPPLQPRMPSWRAPLPGDPLTLSAGRAWTLAPSCPERGPGAQTRLGCSVREFPGGLQCAQEVWLDHTTGADSSPSRWPDGQGWGQAAQLGPSSTLSGPLAVAAVTRGRAWEAGPQPRLTPLFMQRATTPFSL